MCAVAHSQCTRPHGSPPVWTPPMRATAGVLTPARPSLPMSLPSPSCTNPILGRMLPGFHWISKVPLLNDAPCAGCSASRASANSSSHCQLAGHRRLPPATAPPLAVPAPARLLLLRLGMSSSASRAVPMLQPGSGFREAAWNLVSATRSTAPGRGLRRIEDGCHELGLLAACWQGPAQGP
jgi:hypothetical protein